MNNKYFPDTAMVQDLSLAHAADFISNAIFIIKVKNPPFCGHKLRMTFAVNDEFQDSIGYSFCNRPSETKVAQGTTLSDIYFARLREGTFQTL